MRLLDRKLLRDLWRMRSQVVTIALVVASGVGGFIASLSTYDSLHALQLGYYEQARFADVFARAKRAPLAVGDRLLTIAGVAAVETTVSVEVLLDVPEVVEPVTGRMIALPAGGNPSVNRLTLISGRWIALPDSNEALVNEAFARARGVAPGDRVVALLNGKRETLNIVGVVMSPEYIFGGRGVLADEKTFGVFWMGRKRLAAAYNMEGAFNEVAVRLAHGASQPAVLEGLDRVLEAYGSTGAYGRDEHFSHRALTQEINEQRVFGMVLPSIFLAVAVFLLNVVLTRQIGTQRTQIAALKALGYADTLIGMHYLKFVLVIVGLGIVIGIGTGAWLGRGMTHMYAVFFRFPSFDYRLEPWIALTASAATLAGAVLGGLQALLAVVRLPPAEAMRPPSPPTFRPTVLERLGYGQLYSSQTRMILRNIERLPLRAGMTVFAIACGVAILISGTWWRDAVDYLLDIEFRLRERQHVSVMFTEPTSTSVVYELARLPGVLKVEGGRELQARFRRGHRGYRSTVIGLPPRSEMRQLLDDGLRPVEVPAAGIVINQRLADRLEAGRGDDIWLELLQGERRRRLVRIADIVPELVERRAYMDRDALSRLAGDGDAYSSARIWIDPAQRAAFFARIKQTPRIAAIAEVGPIIDNFRRTSGRFIVVFTGILTAFAAVIAVGVVYNHARIALAERAWELASLRVLGYTRGETSALLLGELALQIGAALPLGCVLGYWLSYGIVQLIHTETFVLPVIIAPRTYAYACIVTVLAGVVSALIVRRRIDTLDLTAVLKTRE